MPVPELPLDVITEILAFLPAVDGVPLPDPNVLREAEVSQPSSQAAALTCREWLPLARKNLFRSRVFDPMPKADSDGSFRDIARRLPYLREITWDSISMGTKEMKLEKLEDLALTGGVLRLRVLLEGNSASHSITICLDPLVTLLNLIIVLTLVPGTVRYFRTVYWQFGDRRIISAVTASVGPVMKKMDSVTHLHLSDIKAGTEYIPLFDTIATSIKTHQIVRLGLFDIQFPSGSAACSLTAAFSHLCHLDMGKLVIFEPSETEQQPQTVPPLRFVQITASLENTTGNMIYHESYSYIFRWIASQPEQSKLEDLHFADVFGALDHIKPTYTRNLSCFSRTDGVNLSECLELKRLNITSERLKSFTELSCIQLIIPTLRSVPQDVRLVSLQIELVLPPKDDWKSLRNVLDRPCFQHCEELVIVVRDPEGAEERWHELDIFADLRGFRRMFKHHEIFTGPDPDQLIIDFLAQTQQ